MNRVGHCPPKHFANGTISLLFCLFTSILGSWLAVHTLPDTLSEKAESKMASCWMYWAISWENHTFGTQPYAALVQLHLRYLRDVPLNLSQFFK